MSKLTDEQIEAIYKQETGALIDDSPWALVDFSRAIEAAATEPLLQRIAELERQLEEARAQIGQGEPVELSDDDISELAHSANEEALSFGIGHDLFLRYFKAVRNRALASAPPVPPAPQANKTHVLVPLRMTRAMQDVVSEEDWSWADLLAAAEAVTEDEFTVAEQTEPTMPQASVVQQKPLPDEQKIEMWTNATIECCTHMACYMRGIEDAEAAHNIGEKK